MPVAHTCQSGEPVYTVFDPSEALNWPIRPWVTDSSDHTMT
jgi:hypothetical protein